MWVSGFESAVATVCGNSVRAKRLLVVICCCISISAIIWWNKYWNGNAFLVPPMECVDFKTEQDNWKQILFKEYKNAHVIYFDGENEPINIHQQHPNQTELDEEIQIELEGRAQSELDEKILKEFHLSDLIPGEKDGGVPPGVSNAEPLICNSILYTTHNGRRGIDSELDRYRIAWSRQQDLNCFFIIRVHAYGKNNGTDIANVANHEALIDWRKRTSNDPLVLVERYKAGLILMALVRLKYICTTSQGEEEPWILYVDSDSMMTNYRRSIEEVAARVKRASLVKTLETTFCGQGPGHLYSCPLRSDSLGKVDETEVDKISLVVSLSDYCSRGYFTHSGAFLFRSSSLNGLIFDTIARSPQFVIDTKQYRMGDQAIWDWLMEREFNTDWKQIRLMCKDTDRLTIFRQPCEGDQFIFTRKFTGTQNRDTHPLLIEMENKWAAGIDAESIVAFVCVRWFNSPGCPGRHGNITDFFTFHCGDLLWHLYGCNKSIWKKPNSALNNLLMSQSCQALLPLPLPNNY